MFMLCDNGTHVYILIEIIWLFPPYGFGWRVCGPGSCFSLYDVLAGAVGFVPVVEILPRSQKYLV